MAAYGKWEQCHVEQKDWKSYEEYLQLYFVINDVKDIMHEIKRFPSEWV